MSPPWVADESTKFRENGKGDEEEAEKITNKSSEASVSTAETSLMDSGSPISNSMRSNEIGESKADGATASHGETGLADPEVRQAPDKTVSGLSLGSMASSVGSTWKVNDYFLNEESVAGENISISNKILASQESIFDTMSPEGKPSLAAGLEKVAKASDHSSESFFDDGNTACTPDLTKDSGSFAAASLTGSVTPSTTTNSLMSPPGKPATPQERSKSLTMPVSTPSTTASNGKFEYDMEEDSGSACFSVSSSSGLPKDRANRRCSFGGNAPFSIQDGSLHAQKRGTGAKRRGSVSAMSMAPVRRTSVTGAAVGAPSCLPAASSSTHNLAVNPQAPLTPGGTSCKSNDEVAHSSTPGGNSSDGITKGNDSANFNNDFEFDEINWWEGEGDSPVKASKARLRPPKEFSEGTGLSLELANTAVPSDASGENPAPAIAAPSSNQGVPATSAAPGEEKAMAAIAAAQRKQQQQQQQQPQQQQQQPTAPSSKTVQAMSRGASKRKKRIKVSASQLGLSLHSNDGKYDPKQLEEAVKKWNTAKKREKTPNTAMDNSNSSTGESPQQRSRCRARSRPRRASADSIGPICAEDSGGEARARACSGSDANEASVGDSERGQRQKSRGRARTVEGDEGRRRSKSMGRNVTGPRPKSRPRNRTDTSPTSSPLEPCPRSPRKHQRSKSIGRASHFDGSASARSLGSVVSCPSKPSDPMKVLLRRMSKGKKDGTSKEASKHAIEELLQKRMSKGKKDGTPKGVPKHAIEEHSLEEKRRRSQSAPRSRKAPSSSDGSKSPIKRKKGTAAVGAGQNNQVPAPSNVMEKEEGDDADGDCARAKEESLQDKRRRSQSVPRSQGEGSACPARSPAKPRGRSRVAGHSPGRRGSRGKSVGRRASADASVADTEDKDKTDMYRKMRAAGITVDQYKKMKELGLIVATQ